MAEVELATEAAIRVGCAVTVFLALAFWEAMRPRRRRAFARLRRWPSNLAIALLNLALVRVLVPAGVVGAAVFAGANGWGMLNLLPAPPWAALLIAVVALDLIVYLQHLLFHASRALWRVHRMHHSDLDFDVTTGLRFHPFEIFLSMLIKVAAVVALGAPAAAVVVFEVLLNASSMFNHANLLLPRRVDRALRKVIVTPDMHRVHHSCDPIETNSNFGFNFSWWDRVFGTYREQPAAGQRGMTIGVDGLAANASLRLDRMLIQPFARGAGEYPIWARFGKKTI